jgi:hypothetical protein
MFEIMTAFPNATALRTASPAELGLVALRGHASFEDTMSPRGPLPPFPRRQLIDSIVNGVDGSPEGRAVAAEAVAWLCNHDLLAERYDTANVGSLFVTRLGRAVLAADPPTAGGIAFALRAIDLIPASLRSKIMPPLLAGDFDFAVVAACKAVETRMRERAQLPTSDYGSRLARKFFAKVASTAMQSAARAGDLADEEHLFEGIFGLYRDRAVHDLPHIETAEYALEVIVATGHLLRIVEAADV